MVSNSAKEAAETEEKVNMTPMIDVTFLLLIFFLVTIKFKSLDAKIQVEMPTSFGSQNTGEVEKPKIAIDVDVVEPGMAQFRPAGSKKKAAPLVGFLHPKQFLEPPKIQRYLRGTRLATRKSEANHPAVRRADYKKPPGIKRPAGTTWDHDEWGKKYKDKVFLGRIQGDFQVPYNDSERIPVRTLRYKVREQSPGNADRPIAVCFSIEELHYLMSQLYWKYYRQEMRDNRREPSGKAPDPAKEPDRYDEYKRKSPALVIKAGESVVLAWSIARPGTATPLRTDKRRTLVYKPKFVSYWLAEPTFKQGGDLLSTQLNTNQRMVAPYYDSMGWNVQYEDITEVLDMLNDNVFAENQVKEEDPKWNGEGSWRKDKDHYFGQVFIEQTFVGDSSVGFIDKKFTNKSKYIFDYEPSKKLRVPN